MEDFCQDVVQGGFVRCNAIQLVLSFRTRRGQSAFRYCRSAIRFRFVINFSAAGVRQRFRFGCVANLPYACSDFMTIAFYSAYDQTICLRYVFLYDVNVYVRIEDCEDDFYPSQSARTGDGFAFFFEDGLSNCLSIPQVFDDLFRYRLVVYNLRFYLALSVRIRVGIVLLNNVHVT